MLKMKPEAVSKHYKYSKRFEKVGDTNIWAEINNLSREQDVVDLAEVNNFLLLIQLVLYFILFYSI